MIIETAIQNIFTLIIGLSVLVSCDPQKVALPLIYQGPLKEIENMETIYVEKDTIKLKIKADKIFESQNGDQEFPNGIYMEFYKKRKVKSILQADKAYYFKKTKKWRGQGNVRVDNISSKQKLRTEELFWEIETERIFTNKFISIRLDNELIYGTGLDAAQDLSDYIIKKPGGEFEIED